MSTRCMIGKSNQDGTITSIYSHSDGYPDYTGRILAKHYNTPELIDVMLKLGDISMLGKDINETIFYGRDRGYEEDYEPENHSGLDDYLDFSSNMDFTYLYTGKQWLYRKNVEPKFHVISQLK